MHHHIHDFDLAISFAGEDRRTAYKLALLLKERGAVVFYDEDAQAELLGETLTEYLIDLYKNRASYCVVLVSKFYVEKRWTRHEWKAAQARAFEEIDAAYILPIRLDDAELPGLLPTIGYVSLPGHSLPEIADIIHRKITGAASVNRRFRMADRAYQQGDFKNVISILEAINHAELLRNYSAARLLVDALMAIGNDATALPLLCELLNLAGENAENQFLAGVCCYHLSRFKEAVSHYERTLKLAPWNLTAREDLRRAKAHVRSASRKVRTQIK